MSNYEALGQKIQDMMFDYKHMSDCDERTGLGNQIGALLVVQMSMTIGDRMVNAEGCVL
jgi:hypothetical protein